MSFDRSLCWRHPGARWRKFDFHTHTPASSDCGKGPGQDSCITPGEWLLGFMRAGVDCVAVTDHNHNSGERIDRLKDAYRELERASPPGFRPLFLFPGMEITANGGIHVLAVLDADKGAADVSALLGAVGYRGESAVAAKSAAIGVVEGIREAGGIPILAHVDGPSGAWRLTGNSLAPLFDFDGLFAMEVVDPGRAKPDLYRQRKLTWAEVSSAPIHIIRTDRQVRGSPGRTTRG